MTDELPERIKSRVGQYRVRQVLWERYGLKWDDWTFEEIIEALELNNAEQEHWANWKPKGAK